MNGAANATELSSQVVRATIWIAQLDGISPEALQVYRSWLTASEIEQYSRFLSKRRCREFIAGRGLSRVALASQCHCAPQDLQFATEEKGKLSIIAPEAARGVHFNISHTADLVVCGVCPEVAIGLDVERIGSRLDPLEIARRFFSTEEAVALEGTPEQARAAHFCTLWTLKEALAKAHGLGLAAPLHATSFSVSDDNRVVAVSREQCFPSSAWLAVAAPTLTHRLAVAVLCEPPTVVTLTTRWHHVLPEFAGREALSWAEGRYCVRSDQA
jgi:4'-phosphopantetheinyl transferase